MARLETVHDENWKCFLEQPRVVLLLTVSDCPHCKAWKEELGRFLEQGCLWEDTRFGVVTIDLPEAAEFRKENDWVEQLEGVPFNAFFSNGEPKTSFYGSGTEKLVSRLKRLSGEGK